MSTLKETGQWIMIIKQIPLTVPVDKLSIFYAKPCNHYLKGYRRKGRHEEILKRAGYLSKILNQPTELGGDAYQQTIWEHLNDNSSEIERHRKRIQEHIDRYGYTLDSFHSQAEIVTPFGEVRIHPDEYNTVDLDYALKLTDEGSHVIRYLNNDGSIRDKMKNVAVSDKVFYFQTRGLSFTQAMKLVSGEIKTQYLMYFDPLPQYIENFDRNFIKNAERKKDYCQNNGFEELLHYEAKEDGEKVRFHLDDYLEHLQKQMV